MSNLRQRLDPYLAIIKSCGRALHQDDPELGQQLETERFHLFQALERGDIQMAGLWLKSLEAMADCVSRDFVALPRLREALVALRAEVSVLTVPAP